MIEQHEYHTRAMLCLSGANEVLNLSANFEGFVCLMENYKYQGLKNFTRWLVLIAKFSRKVHAR